MRKPAGSSRERKALAAAAACLAALLCLGAFGASDVRSGDRLSYALTGARVIAAPGRVFDPGVVVARGGIVEAVGAEGKVSIPADARPSPWRTGCRARGRSRRSRSSPRESWGSPTGSARSSRARTPRSSCPTGTCSTSGMTSWRRTSTGGSRPVRQAQAAVRAVQEPPETGGEMNWLFKEEPTHYSFDDLVRDKKTVWSGVRNALAQKHLRSVKKKDCIFYYHTGDEKAIVGYAAATRDAYPDPSDPSGKSYVVDIAPVRKLKRPVTLAEIKAKKSFADFPLVRISRLSVMPVSDREWSEIETMSNAPA